MKTRPILFSPMMVRALLDGRKTQTRRMVKPQPIEYDGAYKWKGKYYGAIVGSEGPMELACNYGRPGDFLWVREKWCGLKYVDDRNTTRLDYCYYADDDSWSDEEVNHFTGWNPSIHMPRRACRLVLRRVGPVRAERLLDIDHADAIAEGVDPTGYEDGMWTAAQTAYFNLWDEINGPGAAALNPWVWVVPFEVAARTRVEAQALLKENA